MTGETVRRVTERLAAGHIAEFRSGGEDYLIQQENNKGWDYISVWCTGSGMECLGRVLFDIMDGVDADTVTELLSLRCIGGQSILEREQCGSIEWK